MDPSFCAARKEYCDRRLDDLRRFMCAQVDAMEKAITISRVELDKEITLARVGMERRLESMNEFRAQLEKQAGTFLARDHFESKDKYITEEIRMLRDWKSATEGAKSWSNILAGAAVLISMVVGILHFFSTMRP